MVDDSPMNLKMCVKLLQRLGADVDKAEDGRIAADMLHKALLLQQEQQAGQSSSSSLLLVDHQHSIGCTTWC